MFSLKDVICQNDSDVPSCLKKFGFAIVEIPSNIEEKYEKLHNECVNFYQLSSDMKQHFQYTYTKNENASTDSLYGYSLLLTKSGAKTEQLMLRGIGANKNNNNNIAIPNTLNVSSNNNNNNDNGSESMSDTPISPQEMMLDKFALLKNFVIPNEILSSVIIDNNIKNTILNTHCKIQKNSILSFILFDKFCRNIVNNVEPNCSSLMDPVNNGESNEAIKIEIDVCNKEKCDMYGTDYYLNGYITSSVLDIYNFNKSNHNDHTDTGLLSLILFNQKNNNNENNNNNFDKIEIMYNGQWIKIEKEFYNYCNENNLLSSSFNKKYGIILFGDQISHANKSLLPILYRINECNDIVTIFKLRASPLRGPFLRYQEDYVIASHNIDIDINASNLNLMKNNNNNSNKNASNNNSYANYFTKMVNNDRYDENKVTIIAGIAVIGVITVGAIYWLRNNNNNINNSIINGNAGFSIKSLLSKVNL